MRDENSEDTGAGSGWWDAFASSSCVRSRGSSKLPLQREFPSITHRFGCIVCPFSVGQVLDYFNEAFGKRPFKTDDKSFVYTDRGNPDEVAIITVSDLEARLGVALLATGDYGVNYIREFFEAPFFLRPESEQLYMLLDRRSWQFDQFALERFNVQMRISEAGRWLVVALEFRPSELYRPQLTLVTSRPVGHQCPSDNFRKGNGKDHEYSDRNKSAKRHRLGKAMLANSSRRSSNSRVSWYRLISPKFLRRRLNTRCHLQSSLEQRSRCFMQSSPFRIQWT